jgi:acyl-CoA reductase-like NAD-dependent aldehyde dehydrogenase
LNPAEPNEVIGRVRTATIEDPEKAIDKTARFFPQWRDTPAQERAKILFKAAEIMRERRWDLAAREVFEVGKGWREADADVCEAIDYLDYYGHEMLRLAEPRETQQLPSETNSYFYQPRGLAAVIAPWNFPLAILTGMTAAALVTGNCVLMKPAEQSPLMGAQLLDILHDAGLPEGACQLLQGGGEIGAHLVRSPKIHLITFTGSREVGLEILREAYTHRRDKRTSNASSVRWAERTRSSSIAMPIWTKRWRILSIPLLVIRGRNARPLPASYYSVTCTIVF